MYRDTRSNVNCIKTSLDDEEKRTTRLHLACGNILLQGWINIDYEARAPGVIQCDLTKGIPFKNETVDEILASHFLEHLKLKHEAIPFLQECHRVLKPGGIMSFITPNFEIIHRSYISKGIGAVASAMFGDGRTMWDYHISGWWPERFRQLAQEGYIHTPGGTYKVWESVELVGIITLWRPHSPYEVTAIYRKSGGTRTSRPTWLDSQEIVGDGFMSPFKWQLRQFISSHPTFPNPVRLVKQVAHRSRATMNNSRRTGRALLAKISNPTLVGSRKRESMKLNLGPGPYPVPGFVNIDVDPSVKPDIVRDVRRGLPFTSDTIEEVRAYHFLEHLAPDDFIFVLTEAYRVLKNGGVFDIKVPLGVTDDPTHRTFFAEGSFNVFLDMNSPQYYRNNMNWQVVKKEMLHEKFPTLHLILRPIKPGLTE